MRLLDRSPRGIEPTIYGRALLDGGVNAFDELRRAVKHIESLADPTAGELRIGATIAIATSFVAAVIDRLSRKYPRIVIHLLAGQSEMTYRALEERRVDLVVARIFAPLREEHVHSDILYDEHEIVVAGAQNRWTRRRSIKLSELVNELWTLAPADSLSGAIFVEAFRAAGLETPRTTVITSTAPARIALLATGRFLTIVPNSVLKFSAYNAVLKRLPVDLPTTRRPMAITKLKNRTLSPVAQLFIDCAHEVAQSLARGK